MNQVTNSNMVGSESTHPPVHKFLVATGVLSGFPILGLIFAIIANSQTKQNGRNRELALIFMIASIIQHAIIVIWLIVVFAVVRPFN